MATVPERIADLENRIKRMREVQVCLEELGCGEASIEVDRDIDMAEMLLHDLRRQDEKGLEDTSQTGGV
jgi:hypothetical protein|tara:strand:+ start:16405 stop:16611 length:207 start_codon:yes stop_codon:yes gene_type:complete